MMFMLAAIGATVAGLLELTIVRHLGVGGAHPHLVLVLGVIWTIATGVESGLVWAFVGGLALDIFAQRPLGSTAFTLLVCFAGVALLGRVLSRVRPVAPIPLVFSFSLVSSLLLMVVYGALRSPIPAADPVSVVLPGVIYDTVVAAILGPLVISTIDRRMIEERAEW